MNMPSVVRLLLMEMASDVRTPTDLVKEGKCVYVGVEVCYVPCLESKFGQCES